MRMVSCAVTLAEFGSVKGSKPRVEESGCEGNSLNLKAEQWCQRWLVPLASTTLIFCRLPT